MGASRGKESKTPKLGKLGGVSNVIQSNLSTVQRNLSSEKAKIFIVKLNIKDLPNHLGQNNFIF